VLLGEQAFLVRQTQFLGEERFRDLIFQQPVAVLREDRVIPNPIVDGQTDESAEQHADGTQRMLDRHEIIQLGHREKAFLDRIRSAHSPTSTSW
jgi:hypothetical protein